jgi:hypothetical protein
VGRRLGLRLGSLTRYVPYSVGPNDNHHAKRTRAYQKAYHTCPGSNVRKMCACTAVFVMLIEQRGIGQAPHRTGKRQLPTACVGKHRTLLTPQFSVWTIRYASAGNVDTYHAVPRRRWSKVPRGLGTRLFRVESCRPCHD